jgi:preprotein translocase subunit SecE
MGVRISPPVQKRGIENLNLIHMNKILHYCKESYKELTEKVTWPTWTELQQSTMIVLVATLVITALIYVMDAGAGSVLKFVYNQLFKA